MHFRGNMFTKKLQHLVCIVRMYVGANEINMFMHFKRIYA